MTDHPKPIARYDIGERVRLANDDICPECRGELDTGFECNQCGFDALPLVTSQVQRKRWEKSDG